MSEQQPQNNPPNGGNLNLAPRSGPIIVMTGQVGNFMRGIQMMGNSPRMLATIRPLLPSNTDHNYALRPETNVTPNAELDNTSTIFLQPQGSLPPQPWPGQNVQQLQQPQQMHGSMALGIEPSPVGPMTPEQLRQHLLQNPQLTNRANMRNWLHIDPVLQGQQPQGSGAALGNQQQVEGQPAPEQGNPQVGNGGNLLMAQAWLRLPLQQYRDLGRPVGGVVLLRNEEPVAGPVQLQFPQENPQGRNAVISGLHAQGQQPQQRRRRQQEPPVSDAEE